MRQSLRFFESMPQADPGHYPILTGAQKHFLIRIRPSCIDESDINQKMCEEVFTPPWSLEITGLTVNGHGLSSQRGTRPIGIGTYDHVILYSTVVWACILAADGRVKREWGRSLVCEHRSREWQSYRPRR